MSLYERSNVNYKVRSDAAIFVRDTYMYFALSLLMASIGAYIGTFYLAHILVGNMLANIMILIVEIGLIFVLMNRPNVTNGALALLFAFTFVSGLSLTSIIFITLQSQQGGAIIAQALFLSTAAFAGLSFFAFTTKKDFSVFAKAAFVVLIVLFVASIINMFVQSSTFSLVISSISAILFSFYIIYDTQMIIRGAYQTPIQAALALYLDFINLFVSLLNILRNVRD